jgi:hypothetical protein
MATSLAFLACASLACGADAAVKVRYLRGQPTYISTMPASAAEVAIPPEQQKARRVGIYVVAFNSAAEPVTLGYENVEIQTAGGEAAKLVTYEDLRRHARVKAAWSTFFAGVAAGLNSYSAARYGGRGSIGRTSFYSPVAGQMALDRANAQNAALFTSIYANLEATLSNLDGSVLRTTTIDPGTSFGGLVVFDLPKGAHLNDMVVTVRFAGNTHSIPLNDAAGGLQQATASDLASPAPAAENVSTPAAGAGAVVAIPVAAGVGAPTPAYAARTAPVAASLPSPLPGQPAIQKCGMIKVDDGYRLVTCRAAESALR